MGEDELFVAGLDLGQATDYTALAILQFVELWDAAHINCRGAELHCRDLRRFPLGTPYPQIVQQVEGILSAQPLRGCCALVVDATGVGRPVVDLFRASGLALIGVTITGGDAVSQDESGYRVPKRDLVSALQVLLQSGRLKFAEGLPEVPTLVRELMAFQVKIDARTAHDTYGAWREGAHDDLVLAVALAAWFVECAPATIIEIVLPQVWSDPRW